MRVTVCQISEAGKSLEAEWAALRDHVRTEDSNLVLLPEMPFYPWLARTKERDDIEWDKSAAAHKAWLLRLPELGKVVVLGSRPVVEAGARWNEAFIWSASQGYQAVHHKYYLPNEALFWEAAWYDRGPKSFHAASVEDVRVGFLICSELWFTEHARSYGRQGVEILACPRATEAFSADKWLIGGQAAAIVSGAFSISSNRAGKDRGGIHWGGSGWIVSPDGEVLGRTTEETPFITRSIDLSAAEAAKATYPRYIPE